MTTTTALIINGEISPGRAYGDNKAGFSTSSKFLMHPATAIVQAIEVRFKAEDFGGPISTTVTANPNDHVSMSNGAKIGLGIGLPLLALLFMTAFTIFWIRRRYRGQLMPCEGDIGNSHAECMEHRAERRGYRFCVSGSDKFTSNSELDTSKTQIDLVADIEEHDAIHLPPPPYRIEGPPELERTAVAALRETNVPTFNAQEVPMTSSAQENFKTETAAKATPQQHPPTNTKFLPAVPETFPLSADDQEEKEEELLFRESGLKKGTGY